jgi:hypothetical protein
MGEWVGAGAVRQGKTKTKTNPKHEHMTKKHTTPKLKTKTK